MNLWQPCSWFLRQAFNLGYLPTYEGVSDLGFRELIKKCLKFVNALAPEKQGLIHGRTGREFVRRRDVAPWAGSRQASMRHGLSSTKRTNLGPSEALSTPSLNFLGLGCFWPKLPKRCSCHSMVLAVARICKLARAVPVKQ